MVPPFVVIFGDLLAKRRRANRDAADLERGRVRGQARAPPPYRDRAHRYFPHGSPPDHQRRWCVA
jgi:hypothetical protein